jgi:hypothetical protein
VLAAPSAACAPMPGVNKSDLATVQRTHRQNVRVELPAHCPARAAPCTKSSRHMQDVQLALLHICRGTQPVCVSASSAVCGMRPFARCETKSVGQRSACTSALHTCHDVQLALCHVCWGP